MDSSKTQQLLKALALDFIHNKSFNTSIVQLLCSQQKIHASTTADEIRTKITVIDKAFNLLMQHCSLKKATTKQHKPSSNYQTPLQRNFNNMLNIFIFNISAINQHYINEIQKQMAQSTASQSVNDLNKTFYKDKLVVNFLRQQLQTYFILLTEQSKVIQSIISDIQSGKRKVTESELGLLQTLDYLCVKYSIRNEVTERIVGVLEKSENHIDESSSQIFSLTVVKDVNQMLFGGQRQADLYQMLETNSHVNFKNVLSIINANYLNTHPPRKIFNTAQLSGKQLIQGLIIRLIKRIGKNELFNQKSQDYTPFRLLLFYFLNKHFSVYLQFNQIVKSLMNSQPLNSQAKLNALKKIQKLIRIMISTENPHLCQILQFINAQLSTKYSQAVAFELVKKLLLNRFLLNPSFYILYNDPDEEEVRQYVEAANVVRALFYTNKVEELAQRSKCSLLVKISSEILKSLEYCLKKENDNKQLNEGNSNFLYINDKILKSQMQQFYDQIKQSFHSPRQPLKQGLNLPNLVSDYSLSFLLVKNDHPSRNNLSHPVIENVSAVNFPNTNRSNNLRDNQSIRYMYQELKGQQKSHNQISPKSPQKSLKPLNKNENKEEKRQQNNEGFGRVSQLARKQHQITNQTRLYSMKLPTDRQMIEELVEMRKEYGEMKRCLKKQFEERKTKHVKKMGRLRAFSARFCQYKEEIEKDNNQLYVHMTTYA